LKGRYHFYTSSIPVLVLLLFIRPFLITAQDSIPDAEVKERLQTIQMVLDEGKPGASSWWTGWLIGYSAATVAQGVVMVATDKLGTRQDMGLGAITTLLGAAGQLVTPMVPAKAPGQLELLPDNTPTDRMNKLIAAEKLFRESAERERSGRSWQTHAVCGAVNITSGLITWFAFDRDFKAGLVNFALNMAITEAQIFTQPTRAVRDYKGYLQKYSPVEKDHPGEVSYSLGIVPIYIPGKMLSSPVLALKITF
jgi:hypothetical protein